MTALRRGKRTVNPKYSSYNLEIRRSRIHSVGVFAMQEIPAHKPIIEYTGKRLTVEQALDLKSPQDRYLVRLSRHWIADGRFGGSGAELVNHSCDPNLQWKRSKGRLTLWSRRRIRAGEELTLRYAYPYKATRVPCRCGSAKCRGTLRYLLE
jgi:uncharacterized protein